MSKVRGIFNVGKGNKENKEKKSLVLLNEKIQELKGKYNINSRRDKQKFFVELQRFLIDNDISQEEINYFMAEMMKEQ